MAGLSFVFGFTKAVFVRTLERP
jgi:hypothetical protein